MATEVDGVTVEVPEQQASELARVPVKPVITVTKAATMAQAFAGLMPATIGEAFILATYLAKSNAIPKGLIGKPESVLTVVMAGMEMGLTPIRSLQSITNISGTLCMKADLQLALVQRSNILAFYEEGFERFGSTDANLQKRVTMALDGKASEAAAELVTEKIMATVAGMKAGDPYGWAIGIRQGTNQVQVRTFTYTDATKAVIYEASEDGSGPKEKKPLAEKFNYKSFPGDMYPKRARTRLLQVLASDVTAGLPAAEAIEGGQVFEAEFTRAGDQPEDADMMLAVIRDRDSELATGIEAGFNHLALGPAKRLQLLVQYKEDPAGLREHLRLEAAKRMGSETIQPGKKATKKAAASHPMAEGAAVVKVPDGQVTVAKDGAVSLPVQAVSTQEVKPVEPVAEVEPVKAFDPGPKVVQAADTAGNRMKEAAAAMRRVSF